MTKLATPSFRNPWDDGPSDPQNPWGSSAPRGNGGGGKNGGGDMPPERDEFLRRLDQGMRTAFGQKNGGGMSPWRLVTFAVVAVLGIWLASGFYFIQPNENAVVLTFGKYTRTDEQAGLKYALPWPIQQAVKVDVTSERRIEIGGATQSAGYPSYLNSMNNEADSSSSLMLTGDENIIDINFVVMWRIGDAKSYLFELRSPEETIRMVASSAIREIIGRTKITAALTEARGQIQADTKALMQKTLDEYQSGVVINNVQLLKVDPPASVIDAFNDVQRARAEAERMQNEAAAYRNDILPRARGAAQKTIEDSLAYKQETMAQAKGDADRFMSVLSAYSAAKGITSERMYLETMEQVLRSAKTIVLDSKGANAALPYLPIGDLKRAPKMDEPPAPSPISNNAPQ